MDTPYQWTKQVASHWGGTRNGMVVHWPARIAARGEVRTQFHHVIDLAPTILEAAGLPAPTKVNGIPQMPLHGTSLAYTYDDAAAPDRRTTQYFESFVNRGIYHEGWTAVTRHSTPWVVAPLPPIADDRWELYGPDDWTQAHDLAAEMPDKLDELKALFLEEAAKYKVLPLDDRRIERYNADLAGRPQLIHGTTQVLYGGMQRLSEASVISIKNRSHSITARYLGAGRGRVGRGRGPGFGVSAAGPCTSSRAGRRTATTCSACAGSRSTARARSRPASTRCMPSSRTTAAGSPRAEPSRCTSTEPGRRGPRGWHRADVFSGDETPMSGPIPARRSATTTTRARTGSRGTVHRVAISIGADAEDPDHLVSPDDWFRLVMARE